MERVPEGVRSLLAATHALGAMDHRASQLQTHRNLMIATLVREVLKGTVTALPCGCDLALEHFTVGDRGKTPQTEPPPPPLGGGNGLHQLVMFRKTVTGLHRAVALGQGARRSAGCWRGRSGGYRRRRRDRRSRRGFRGLFRRRGWQRVFCVAAGCCCRSGSLHLAFSFRSAISCCCMASWTFSSAAWRMPSRSTFQKNFAPGEHAHHQRQQEDESRSQRKPPG